LDLTACVRIVQFLQAEISAAAATAAARQLLQRNHQLWLECGSHVCCIFFFGESFLTTAVGTIK
jgi:hypothetical protein